VLAERGYLVILLRAIFTSDSIRTTRDSAQGVLKSLGYHVSRRLREDAPGGYCPRDIAVSVLEAIGYEVTLREADPDGTQSRARTHLQPIK
jgi:hypothetical protein